MKKLVIGLLAVAGIAVALPANAQGVYFGFGNGQDYDHDRGYRRDYDDGYRNHRPRYSYDNDSYARDYRECRVVRVWDGDHYRRIRRCR